LAKPRKKKVQKIYDPSTSILLRNEDGKEEMAKEIPEDPETQLFIAWFTVAEHTS
jgi:hypothetical protein